MAIDEQLLAEVRERLDAAERVDASRIVLGAEAGALVLHGAVATAEEATVAGMLAEQHVAVVRNELRVDANLREAADPGAEGAGDVRPRASRPRGEQLSVQTDAATAGELDGDLVTDADHALAENVPWDPPDEPQLAATASEQRGLDRPAASLEEPADAGPVEPDEHERPSAADLSAAELARSARPRGRSQPPDGGGAGG